MDLISIIVGSIEAITAVAVVSFGASIFANYFGRGAHVAEQPHDATAEQEGDAENAADEEGADETAQEEQDESARNEDEHDAEDSEDEASEEEASKDDMSEDEADKADTENEEDKDSDSDKDADGKRGGVFVAAVPVGNKDDEDEDEEEDEEEKSGDEKPEEDADKADDKDEDKDSDSAKDSDGKRNGVFVAAVPVGSKDEDEEEDEEEEEPHVPVIVEHINAIEADELMSDELALALVIEEDEDDEADAQGAVELNAEGAAVIIASADAKDGAEAVLLNHDGAHTATEQPIQRQPKIEGQKGHINLGEVDAAFEAGAVVTLDALKQKGLVQRKVKRIKILADGELTKPLTVRAHSFSIQAIKMIELTGGTVIKLR